MNQLKLCEFASAILIERPSRRPLLTMYVANVATETLWRMACSRGLVKGIPNGQAIIFGTATSALVYYFRSGMHLEKPDSIFSIVRFMVGKDEEGKKIEEENVEPNAVEDRPRRKILNYLVIQEFLKIHKSICDRLKALPKHEKCPHHHSCVYYSISAGTKLFGIGLAGQIGLKILLNITKIVKSPKSIMNILFKKDTLKIGAFLGGFSFIFRVSKVFQTCRKDLTKFLIFHSPLRVLYDIY